MRNGLNFTRFHSAPLGSIIRKVSTKHFVVGSFTKMTARFVWVKYSIQPIEPVSKLAINYMHPTFCAPQIVVTT